MGKKLKVINPFFVMEEGDEFELSKDGKYVSEYSAEYSDNDSIASSYRSTYEISSEMAKSLVADGYLEEIKEDKRENYVNVFNEIEKLISEYASQLKDIENEFENMPACLRVEKETVLSNMVKVLNHLHSLKK